MVLQARHTKIAHLIGCGGEQMLREKGENSMSHIWSCIKHESNLDSPIFINKEIWGLQISMHNDRMASMQVIHSLCLQRMCMLAHVKKPNRSCKCCKLIDPIPHQGPFLISFFRLFGYLVGAAAYINYPCK